MLTLKEYLYYIYNDQWLEWDIYKNGPEPEPLAHDIRLFAFKCFIINRNITDEASYRSVLISCMTMRNTFPEMIELAAHELQKLLERPRALTLIQRTSKPIAPTLSNYRTYISDKIKKETDPVEIERLQNQQLSDEEYWTWRVFLDEYSKNKKVFIKACPYLPFKPELDMFTIP